MKFTSIFFTASESIFDIYLRDTNKRARKKRLDLVKISRRLVEKRSWFFQKRSNVFFSAILLMSRTLLANGRKFKSELRRNKQKISPSGCFRVPLGLRYD